jgi:hypothetical protein
MRLVSGAMMLIGFIACFTVADAIALDVKSGAAAIATQVTQEPAPDEVIIGAYIENIQGLDLSTNSFMADLYVWMRWQNPDIAPYKSLEIMNPYETWALAATPLMEEPISQPDGSLYYSIRYQGGFNSAFELSKFPFGEQILYIQFEDQLSEASQMRYVLDAEPIMLDPQITIPGFNIGQPTISVEDMYYATNFGNLNSREDDVYSRVTINVPVSHPFFATSLKVLLPILLVIATASLIFHVPPTLIEPRVGLGITALLTLVAMQWSALSDLPDGGYLVMLDILYILSFAFVLATLIQTLTTSWRARAGDEAGAIRLDRRAMYIDLGVYLALASLVILLYMR